MADLLLEADTDFHKGDGFRQAVKLNKLKSEIPAGACLSSAVTDLLGDSEPLLVVFDRALRLSEGGVRQPQVAEGGTLAAAVTDFLGDGQVLLVKVDGPLRL